MPPTTMYKIPDEISNDNELNAWYEQELEKLGEDPLLQNNYELLMEVYRYFRKRETRSKIQFDRSVSDYYKKLLVSALMAKGWEIKNGVQNNQRMGKDAIRAFKYALTLNPNNPKACYRLGHLLKDKSEIGEAVGYFSKALELSDKQDNFQEDLKLSDEQIANASGHSIALLQKLTGSLKHDIKFTFEPEQIAVLQNLIQQTYYTHVIYLTKVGSSMGKKTIDSCEYDDLIENLKCEPKAIVIDRYNEVSLLRYLNKTKRYESDTPISGKLTYLLKSLGLEELETTSVRPNTITQNVGRVNQDLKEIGVDKWVEIAYLGSKFSSKCDLSVHYFKTLLH